MTKPAPAKNETERLAALRNYAVLDTPGEKDFDDLVALAAHICGAPIALISLVDESRQWFKATFGLAATETSRDVSFCAHAIHQSEVFIVPDATQDQRFVDNPLVTGEPGIRFYAGSPLMSPDGQALGTLCVIDRQPRQLTADQEQALAVLSRHVMAQLELRRQTREMTRANSALLGILEDVRQAEKAMQESRALYHSLVEQMPAGIFRKDAVGRYVFVNSRFCKLSATTPESYLGKTAEEAIRELSKRGAITLDTVRAAELGQQGAGHHAAIMRTGVPLELEETRRSADGREQFFQVTKSPVFDAEGKVVGTQGILMDITERKQAEELVHLSNERFQTMARATNDAVWDWDLVTNALWWNDGFQTLFGYAAVEIEPDVSSWITRLHPEDLARVEAGIHQAIESGENRWSDEYRFRRQDGSYAEVFDRGFILRDARGQAVRMIGAMMDITERKQTEAQLRWRTALFEAQAESSIDGILVVDSDGKTILQNRRLSEVWKIPPDVAESKDDAKQIQFVMSRTKNPAQFLEKVTHLYNHPDEVSRDEIELVDGIILDRYSAPVRDQAGKHYGRIWIFRDITSRRKLEEQLRQSQKMEGIGRLAGGVAHDFNNILAAIQVQASLLKFGENLSLAHLELADEIGASVQRAADLTRQLLVFSRKEILHQQDMDLNQSVTSIGKLLGRTIGEDIELKLKLAAQPLYIRGDVGMVDQVLMNLTVNARDAMPKGGDLLIETASVEFDELAASQHAHARPGSYVRLSVSDTGSGIPAEILPMIFDPFFTTKDVGKGTGLGLATVFSIVQQHHGWINVYSEVGRGTTFRIYFPRLEKMSAKKSSDTQFTPLAGGSETILLVEDDKSLNALTSRALIRLGYRVLPAFNGVEALAVWKEHRTQIQLVLTDLVMPGGINGKELGEQLLRDNPKLKIIYSSGYSAEVAGKDFPLHEGVNFLAKPFQAHKLAQTIRNRLDA